MVAPAPAAQIPAQVLIVDDNEDASTSLMMLLELEDITATAVPDARAALSFVERTAPQLLLVDIGLPDMNGIELAKRLRQMPNTSKSTLIALTGREDNDGNTLGAVFDQYWTKPFDPKKLLAEVKAILRPALDA